MATIYWRVRLVVQAPWTVVCGSFFGTILPGGAGEAAMFTHKNFTPTDTIVRYACQIQLSADQVVGMIANIGTLPSLKYYMVNADDTLALTNGGIAEDAAAGWTEVQADIDTNDTEVPRAQYVIDTLDDSGVGSLREALEASVSAGTKKEIIYDGVVAGIIAVDTPLEPVGEGVVRGETAGGAISLKNNAGTATPLVLFDDTNTPKGGWTFYHHTFAPCTPLDGAFGVHIGAGWSDLYFIYCSGRYGGGEAFHHWHPYNNNPGQVYNQPNTRIAFIRCIIARPFSSHNVGMFLDAYDGTADDFYTSEGYKLTSKFLAYKCAFLAAGHRTPLVGVGSSSQVSSGGSQVVNCCGYAFSESSFAMAVVGEAVADFINNYFVSRKATAPSQLSSDFEYRQLDLYSVDPSIYESGSICVYADATSVSGQDMWHVNNTDHPGTQSLIPSSWWRETPLENWYGYEIVSAAEAWQDVIVNQNVGAGAGLGDAFRTVGDATDLADAAAGTLTYPLNGDDIDDYGGVAMLAAVS